MWILLLVALGALVAFLVVLIVRALLFKPQPEEQVAVEEVLVDEEAAVQRFARLIRCKTVSSRDESLVDWSQFEAFQNLLKELYPRVHRACLLEYLGSSGLLYHLKGKSKSAPSVLMSHYDVVPAEESAWEKPPFEGIVEDGVIWGRGTLDTKATLFAALEAAERLLTQGFIPKNDIYFAFAGDEETSGDSAPAIVAELERRGIRPALVLDEGGAVVENVFPGVNRTCALIGTAEKGILDVELSLASKGGHASAPPPHTLVGQLARAVVSIEKKPFKSHLTPPVAAMFDALGRHSTFAYRLIFANLGVFMPVLDAICRKQGGELNAMMRTTCAFTMMEGSKAINVLPPSASVRANLRIIGGESRQSAVEYLRSVAGDANIEFKPLYGMDPSPSSQVDNAAWGLLKNAVAQTWPEALISPYLMVACSDSRHYCAISDSVYRFSAMALSKEERGMIHGHNERIPVSSLIKAVQFYTRLVQQL